MKLRSSGACLALALLACPGRAGAWSSWPPALKEVRSAFASSEALILDRRGRPLQELRLDLKGRRLRWTPLSEVSAAVKDAVLAAEDRRFFSHHGVDWAGLAAAALRTAVSGRMRGASTVTMQTAGFLDHGLKPRNRRRGPSEKVRQIRLALELERSWSKAEVLEAYLNLVAARGEFQGIEALSQGLFGKQPHGISSAEASILAGLLREPGASRPAVLARGRSVARASGWAIPDAELGRAVDRALSGQRWIRPSADAAPLAGRRILSARPAVPGRGEAPASLILASTLDSDLQAKAASILKERLASLAGRNAADGAVLVADNATGEVLAYVANNGQDSSARHVDGITARRQAGSTLKPFLYALALDRKLLTAASPLDDSPVDVAAGRGVFRPENYDRRFRGWVTVRQALAGSVNIPAVRALSLLGPDAFVSTLDSLGFSGLAQGDYYGPSLALGSADVSLWELVAAYRSLADHGLYAPLTLTPGQGVGRKRRVFSKEAAWVVADILSDRTSRSASFGLESPLDTRFWTAVKTGTSKDMRDNWCVGVSERYTVGVWVGNFSGAPMWNVSGVSGAAPVWQEVMSALHDRVPSRQARPAAGLERRMVRPLASTELRQEWFLAGTEPASEDVEEALSRPRILSPVSGTIVALDPDIPLGHEDVAFRALSGRGLKWRLDHADVAEAGEDFSWPPSKGHHILELADSSGRVLDRSEFTVRGESPQGLDALETDTELPDAHAGRLEDGGS
ncbi:MAG: penicillin-binding protein 1C [Elusimicrobia bacterium]|nr:penicillin-binding protein 1C [Elusimicrobiota bacterium]